MENYPIEVQAVCRSDHKTLVELAARIFNLSPTDLENIWIWRYENNPALKDQSVRGWVAKRDGVIIGFLGLIPQYFHVNGSQQVLSFASQLFVLPEYRGLGLGTTLKAKHLSMKFPISISAVAATVSIATSLGFEEIPGNLHQQYLWPMNFANLLRAKFAPAAQQTVLRKLALTAIRPFGALSGHAYTYWSWRRKSDAYFIQPCETINEDFDALWDKLKHTYSIIGVRSKEYLQWRYFDHPQHCYRLLTARNDRKQLLGYIVYRIQRTPDRDLRLADILDIFCDHHNSTLLSALVRSVILEAQHSQVDGVRIKFPPTPVRAFARKHHFICVRFPHSPALFKNNAGLPHDLLLNGDSWYICPGDGDADLGL